MTANFTDISVCAYMSELPALQQALADRARQLGFAEEAALRLQLIVEELFTNTVTHGHGGGSDAPVTCRITRHPAGALLRYTDAAPPYDLASIPEQMASETVIGGLGVTLIRGLSQKMQYTRQNSLNVCEILI